MYLLLPLTLLLTGRSGPNLDALVGKPVDIASSAYQYRADRAPDANPPESWLALMHVANLPLNKPVDLTNPAIEHALCGLLWEEIRPVQELELTWPSNARRRPNPDQLQIDALVNHGTSSSWWNNLDAVVQDAKAVISNEGRTYTYTLGQNTCGLVVSVRGEKGSRRYDVPQVRVLTPDAWKRMDVEIEWGFDAKTNGKDYSGRLETYDGRIADLQPLAQDDGTSVAGDGWRSDGASDARRGIKLSLLYQGTTRWRARQDYTTHPDEVARTIVTVWTKAGNFSFNPADLEHGPILAPEYGFFVRRTSALSATPSAPRLVPAPFGTKMESVVQSDQLKGWGTSETPLVVANPTDAAVSSIGVTLPAHSVAIHPGQDSDVVAAWRSPIKGTVRLAARLAHAQQGGHGIEWWLVRDTTANREILAHGTTNGSGSNAIPFDGAVAVEPGDSLSVVLGNKGDYRACTTIVDWTITEIDGQNRTWNLAKDVAGDILVANPHADGFGAAGVWLFGSEMPMNLDADPSDPPIDLASNALSAREFEAELAARKLATIREQTRIHHEMTWREAVEETRGKNLPPVPAPPAGDEPLMRVHVPDENMTAQWNLGQWHLLRHCAANPTTGKLWFNDYPYGILAAETYMVLTALDDIGDGAAAQDGFDQWTSLPLVRDHPVGLFTEGNGALTFAVGPPGVGGNMDGIHAFGAGSIGWALARHYWMTGDKGWLKRNASRIEANAAWMLRQRQVDERMVPGGRRLWCKGLQPALQVTPDSGGLWMQFYEAEAYYSDSLSSLADTLTAVDPAGAAKLKKQADAYRKDLRAAVERSIALSPVVPVRDGTYHSVVPFACYVRGPATGAWGWRREGSGHHVGPLYWDTVQTGAALVSPAGILSPNDVRVQGWLDVLEDRYLLENANVDGRNWFFAGWQYQMGLERTSNMELAADDVPAFLRSFLNGYAVDILPNDGYVFNEHAVHGPPDKIFEEAAFLERFRDMLVMEDGRNLWLARATPRAWLASGELIDVENAPTRFGDVDYEIVSHLAERKIAATVTIPSRNAPAEIWLRLRTPSGAKMKSVEVDGKPWRDFDAAKEIVKLHGLTGTVKVEVRY